MGRKILSGSARRVGIINGKNILKWMDNEDIFAQTLTGFGTNISNDITVVDDRLFLEKSSIQSDNIPLNIMFGAGEKAPYMGFIEFVDFLSYKPLTLRYEIPGVGYFDKDVALNGIDKGEMTTNGTLECSFGFDTLSHWYKTQRYELKTAQTVKMDIPGTIYYSKGYRSRIRIINDTGAAQTISNLNLNNACSLGTFTDVYAGLSLPIGNELVFDNLLGYRDVFIRNMLTGATTRKLSARQALSKSLEFSKGINTFSTAIVGPTSAMTLAIDVNSEYLAV